MLSDENVKIIITNDGSMCIYCASFFYLPKKKERKKRRRKLCIKSVIHPASAKIHEKNKKKKKKERKREKIKKKGECRDGRNNEFEFR